MNSHISLSCQKSPNDNNTFVCRKVEDFTAIRQLPNTILPGKVAALATTNTNTKPITTTLDTNTKPITTTLDTTTNGEHMNDKENVNVKIAALESNINHIMKLLSK